MSEGKELQKSHSMKLKPRSKNLKIEIILLKQNKFGMTFEGRKYLHGLTSITCQTLDLQKSITQGSKQKLVPSLRMLCSMNLSPGGLTCMLDKHPKVKLIFPERAFGTLT